MVPTIEDISAAAARLAGVAVRTPLLRCDALDEAVGARVWVKAESLQRGGAFKLRGAYNAIAALAPEARARGVVAYSSGNHAIAVSIAAKLFGVGATIVMPADAPAAKRDAVRANDATVIPFDRVRERREDVAAKASGAGQALIKPFDDAMIVAGQGTIGLEIGAEIAPDIVLTPASGGGLASGLAIALPRARVIAVEPEGHDDIVRSLASGARERNAPGVRSICDGLLSESTGEFTYPIVRARLAGAVAMPDSAVKRAMAFAFRHLKLVLEPSGAIALAAALEGGLELAGACVAVIASGGNVDAAAFAAAIAG
jgi:threonine dehydratase